VSVGAPFVGAVVEMAGGADWEGGKEGRKEGRKEEEKAHSTESFRLQYAQII